ncbi:TIGR02444 family protein [Tardiphaga sp. 866_E4_N2_1]|uniref:TIGR02444 family protein n=1 Tax=unclassified Tardiphaga TaxID=2631404 RepID=UPI003F25A89A
MGQGIEFSEESWRFALRLYEAPGVSEACLRLQAEAEVDVMFMLVTLFAASHKGVVLTSSDIGILDENCRTWRDEVIKPLRRVRTVMKRMVLGA